MSTQDPRNIVNGFEIPKEGYCDQPYVVLTDDGGWLCTLTTGPGEEGHTAQHVVATKSFDQGKTWSAPVPIEPAGPPESSWVMPVKVPGGRVYALYVFNRDNLREVISDFGPCKRVDTLGAFMFRYSDDHGKTWSAERYEAPIREMRIDRENPYEGKVRFFWGVGKPMIDRGKVYIGVAKVGRFGPGFMARSEGIFLCSDNLLTEKDPTRIRWQTLPDGDEGLKSPAGPIAEEQNLVALSDGSLYCTYRTVEGFNCHAYSRDGGHTWTAPEYATYSPGGRRIKHPRAANFVRRFSNGKFLLWYHNHGGEGVFEGKGDGAPYSDRNPVWLCGGVEKDGFLFWSQPEILLYDDDPNTRMSYPDFIEDGGRFFVTETQKTVARVHPLDDNLLDGLWNQAELREAAREGVVLHLPAQRCHPGTVVAIPPLPDPSRGGGFSLDLWVWLDRLDAGQVLLDTRGQEGKGVLLTTTAMRTVRLTLNDGRTENAWECDRGMLATGRWHHLAVTVDGGPKIITFVVDGVLCDGGPFRQFGWGRFNPHLRDVTGSGKLTLAPDMYGRLGGVRLYGRPLRTSEAVGNSRVRPAAPGLKH